MIYVDQLGRKTELSKPPGRIISLVPSITETLFYLGLEDKIVGRTRYCIHPNGLVDKVTVVGGTKKIVKDRIEKLQPDLVIANKEENTKEEIDWIAERFNVEVTNVYDFSSALQMIKRLGELTGRREHAEKLANEILVSFQHFETRATKPSVVYLIWKDPFMAAGSDTFISNMLDVAGYHNILRLSRYPVLTAEEIVELKPDFVFLSTEPYRFTEQLVSELQHVFVKSKVVLVDGEMFSWYGSRMLKSAKYFETLRSTIGA